MLVGILKEAETENRVGMLPSEVIQLRKLGFEVIVERNAGERAFAPDNEYLAAGAEVGAREKVFSEAAVILTVNPPVNDNLNLFRQGLIVCTVLNPAENSRWLDNVRLKGVTVLALDMVPRISRAQSMDILSSMATVSGYKAVLSAASRLPRFFPMFMSASGTIKPSRVLVLGAGVAGLQAVAVARKLGAVVEVFDVRAAVREEVNSLGGKFIEVEGAREDSGAGGYAVEQSEDYKRKQQDLIQQRAIQADVIIGTAQIPGKKAPLLILKETVAKMKPGSVIIDLAASSGGNCELTENGKTITVNGVSVTGKSDYPSEMAADASKMFGNNVVNLLKLMTDGKGNPVINIDDEIINGTTAVHKGEYISQRVMQILNIK